MYQIHQLVPAKSIQTNYFGVYRRLDFSTFFPTVCFDIYTWPMMNIYESFNDK